MFTNAAGWRSATPFVVRDDASTSDLCVVLPFTTYQAYNRWPLDGKLGKSFYRGYPPAGQQSKAASVQFKYRAFKVSYDRPYAGNGQPALFDLDQEFVLWVERSGYNVTYATSIDLHEGRIDPKRHAGLVFTGHDEYWTATMRESLESAIESGTHVAFMGANNVFWRTKLQPSTAGHANRLVVCYKGEDPVRSRDDKTIRWRHLPGLAEQGILGVQYVGVPAKPEPLVVKSADHWLWKGAGVQNGDRIDNLVGGEADGSDVLYPTPESGKRTLVSASPFIDTAGRKRKQNTSVAERRNGAIVFCAGTFHWALALNPGKLEDKRIQKATTNLFNKIVTRPH